MNSIKNREARFSLAANNKALSEVFESISKQTSYVITYNEEWGSFPISIILMDVALDTGLEKILKSNELSYFITYNYNDKKIVIDITDGNNVRREKRKSKNSINEEDMNDMPPLEAVENRGDDEEMEFLDLELVPPNDMEESGITPRELMEMRKYEKEVDLSDLELVPSEDSGESGVTSRELMEMRKDEKEIDFSDLELVPPEND